MEHPINQNFMAVIHERNSDGLLIVEVFRLYSFLEGRDLIAVGKQSNGYLIQVHEASYGGTMALEFAQAYQWLCNHMSVLTDEYNQEREIG